MAVSDALKQLRSELNFTQTDLANAIHVNYATISRWELKKTYPNRSLAASLMTYARLNGATEECLSSLERAFAECAKDKPSGKVVGGRLTRSFDNTITDELPYPIYICNADSYELLYMNKSAENRAGIRLEEHREIKCYECFMHRDAPCVFCHKKSMRKDCFTGFDAFRPDSSGFYRVYGKIILWQGQEAQLRYVQELSGIYNVIPLEEREAAYRESLRAHKEHARSSPASAHYNLTKNTVCDIESTDEKMYKLMSSETLDDILARIEPDRTFSSENGEHGGVIDSKSMTALYYRGVTRVNVKHYIHEAKGYYEISFELMQNPVTYDIEAFASLRDVSEETIANKIIDKVFRTDYETVFTIDSETGGARPFCGENIRLVIDEQKRMGDNSAGVEAYFHKYCADGDAERVIKETSLSYVKKQLEIKSSHAVVYSVNYGGKRIYKKAYYTYLDNTKALILCTVQDISADFRDSMLQRDRLSEAVSTLHEISGINIARYDIKSRMYYTDHQATAGLGYSKAISDVPDIFVRDNNVAPQSVDDFVEFFSRLRKGEPSTASVYLRADDGFHLYNAYSRIVYDENRSPYEAIIIFRDMEQQGNT